MKKLMFITLLLILTGAMVFAVGSRQQSGASTGTPTLQIGIQAQPNVSDFVDNYLTHYLERLNNVKLDFLVLPSSNGDFRTRISLLATSNDLPETIWTNGALPTANILEYGSSGRFISLNRYFNDPSKTPYFNRIPAADKDSMLRLTRSGDGNNYAFPRFEPQIGNLSYYRRYINRDWLAKLGLQEPRTTEDLRNVLIAFRDRDPNGNGRRDEIGVFGFMGGWGTNVVTALINAFVYYNGTFALDSTGNNIITPITDPNFRKALQYINGLYRDGLFEASTFTVDETGYRALINADPPIVGFTVSGWLGGHFTYGLTDPRHAIYYPMIAPLTGPDGVSYSPFDEYFPNSYNFITNRARDVDLALKVMDSFYSEDVSIITRYGEENVDWTRDPAITRIAPINGYVSAAGLTSIAIVVSPDDVWGRATNKIWGNTTPRYADFVMANATASMDFLTRPITAGTGYRDDVNEDIVLYYQLNYPRHPQYLLSGLSRGFTADDLDAIAEPASNVSSYLDRSIAQFITGERDINSDTVWNAYLRELDNMGLQQYLRVAQQAYNRIR